MSVRRLLTKVLLVIGMLALPVPANAGPRTDAAFVRATNADRRANHLTSLPTSATLTRLARSHSVAMAAKSAQRYRGRCNSGALWHNNISKASNHWVWLGQNVGCGSLGSDGLAASVQRIQDPFIASTGHRRNILYRKATCSGVGSRIQDGVIWVTVNFEQTTPGWS